MFKNGMEMENVYTGSRYSDVLYTNVVSKAYSWAGGGGRLKINNLGPCSLHNNVSFCR